MSWMKVKDTRNEEDYIYIVKEEVIQDYTYITIIEDNMSDEAVLKEIIKVKFNDNMKDFLEWLGLFTLSD